MYVSERLVTLDRLIKLGKGPGGGEGGPRDLIWEMGDGPGHGWLGMSWNDRVGVGFIRTRDCNGGRAEDRQGRRETKGKVERGQSRARHLKSSLTLTGRSLATLHGLVSDWWVVRGER